MKRWFALDERVRYLVVGVWNTAFGYGVFAALWALGGQRFHYTAILTVGYVVSLTQNFILFKWLVFRTTGHWLPEYLRTYVVYAGGYALNLALLALLVGKFGIRVLIAQLVCVGIVTVVSYAGHRYFTFRRRKVT